MGVEAAEEAGTVAAVATGAASRVARQGAAGKPAEAPVQRTVAAAVVLRVAGEGLAHPALRRPMRKQEAVPELGRLLAQSVLAVLLVEAGRRAAVRVTDTIDEVASPS